MLHRRNGGVVAVHAGHAERELVVVGDHTARHERRDRWDTGELAELTELVRGEGLHDAAAGVDDRLLGLRDQLDGAPDLAWVTERAWTVSGHVDRVRVPPLGLVLENVLRDVDEHRAGTPRGRDVE